MSGQTALWGGLTLEEKVGQMLVVGFHGLEPPDHILRWLADGRIGGVILFARNVRDPAQVAELTRACREAAPRPILVAIDQEGGVVARLRDGFTESPGAMTLGAAGSEELAEGVSMALGAEMRVLGINWNLAPALDLTHNTQNPSVGVRSLGVDPDHVSRLGVAQLRGFQRAGVAATAKHFPGKANTPVDPHVSLPVIDGPLNDMWDTDLVPFRAASDAGVAAMMVTHVQFKALEPDHPSTLSPSIIKGLLREDVGFKGLVSTDCMEMKAVTNRYGPGESAVLAALAGANVILFSHTLKHQEAAYDALLDAARTNRLPMEEIDFAVERIREVKGRFAITGRPSLEAIRRPEHLEIAARAARSGTVLLRVGEGVLPLLRDGTRRVALIEFASHLEKETLENGARTHLASLIQEELLGVEGLWLDAVSPSKGSLAGARALASSSDVVIVATRNAHLIPQQRELAQELLVSGSRRVLLCLRNPYDAGALKGAEAVICTCGDAMPSLVAAAQILAGRFKPTARLPVPLQMG
jgi:beta-N-acetylhexosaminidase